MSSADHGRRPRRTIRRMAASGTVMVEAGNMRNDMDARALTSATFRQPEATATTHGLRTWLHR